MDQAATATPAAPTERVDRLRLQAHQIREYALQMAEVQGQGYLAQALGVADILAVAYGDQLRYRPDEPRWEGRDRFLLSAGHYAIALYAALSAAGVLPRGELETYGTDGSRLPMSGMAAYTPGMEISGGSLGHGLGIAVGMGLALRRKGSTSCVYTLLSDGELDEGSTWEAALAAAHWRLDTLIAIVDVNGQQADAPAEQVLGVEPLLPKWEAFGWFAQRVDGHDIAALLAAFEQARALAEPRPRVLLCDTRLAKGIPFLEQRERAHFIRVEPHEWALARAQLAAGRPA